MSRSIGLVHMYQQKDIFTWNIQTLCPKVITKDKNFKQQTKAYCQAHRVKNVGMLGTTLSQGILMWIMKTLAFFVQNLLARLSSSRSQGIKCLYPTLRSCHKKYSFEILEL